MKNELIFQTLSVALMLFLFAGKIMATDSGLPEEKIDWAAFMQQHDMTFDQLPTRWQEAPHFGNAMIGSMLYQADNTIRLQVFCADVHDHRDDTYGWPAYSRARFQVGHFSLNPVGKLIGCSWRKDLWNAELTGTIKTDKGEIQIRHFTHADDMAIVTELTLSAGEQGFNWTWHPAEARTSRGGYPHGEGYFMGRFCIDRHNMAVNISYTDGHSDKVALEELWTTRWSRGFEPNYDVEVTR